MRRTLAFGLALIAIASQVKQLHAETCPEQVSREIAEMRKQQVELRSGPYESGPIQELGQCTRQALLLGLTFAARGPASEQQAAKEEAANCLQLRIEAISNSCFCRQLGADIGRDLDMNQLAGQMKDVGSAYQRMTQAAARARQRAIANPLIQQYVANAEKYRQCYDRLSINILDETARKLDALDPSDSAPTVNASIPGVNVPTVNSPGPTAGTPTVNAPSPGGNGPTVNTPGPTVGQPTVTASTPGTNGPTVNAATPAVPAGAGALAGVVAANPSPSAAGNCADLRNNIAAMDAQSNAMPGYLGLRVQLASIYNRLCGSSPAQRAEYWYTIDGKKLGPVDAGNRPANAAYAATADVGDQCAGAANPSMCALAAGAFGNCKAPPSDLQSACAVMGGYGDPADTVAATGGDPLPDAKLTIGGKTYDVPNACAQALARVGDGGRSHNVIKTCPDDLLAALGQAEGKDAAVDPTAFLNGLGPLLNKGFAPPGAAPKGGFDQAFCAQMQNNAQVCKQRQDNMVSCVPTGNPQQPCLPQDNTNMSGQAGAFGDCYKLYSSFAGMCRMNVNQRPQIAKASLPKPPPPPAPKPAPPPQAQPQAPQQPQMSAQCQQLVSNYVSAAQANDGPRALAGYNALKNAGGCGVLAKVDRPMPQAAPAAPADDPRFVARGATPLSDQVVGGCNASPAECQRRVQQLRAGVSPEAQAAIFMNAVSIGLQLGATMANGLAATMPRGGAVGGGGTNMNSIGNKPVQHTYGQGAPTQQPAPRPAPTPPPCAVGGPGWCTAQ
jgi:hypothetical protein